MTRHERADGRPRQPRLRSDPTGDRLHGAARRAVRGIDQELGAPAPRTRPPQLPLHVELGARHGDDAPGHERVVERDEAVGGPARPGRRGSAHGGHGRVVRGGERRRRERGQPHATRAAQDRRAPAGGIPRDARARPAPRRQVRHVEQRHVQRPRRETRQRVHGGGRCAAERHRRRGDPGERADPQQVPLPGRHRLPGHALHVHAGPQPHQLPARLRSGDDGGIRALLLAHRIRDGQSRGPREEQDDPGWPERRGFERTGIGRGRGRGHAGSVAAVEGRDASGRDSPDAGSEARPVRERPHARGAGAHGTGPSSPPRGSRAAHRISAGSWAPRRPSARRAGATP